ncbi:hypothetical protein Tco_1163156 [Tanacetum coccineum]
MAKSNNLYDVKICVRSSVKLLGEIKDLLERNPTRESISPDMDNSKVSVAGMGIHNADGQNDIPNANDNAVNQGIIGSANDSMLDVLIQVACDGMGIDKADGNNDYTYSQREPSTLDVLVDEFADDYMDVLNDEESIPNYSLDDMKFRKYHPRVKRLRHELDTVQRDLDLDPFNSNLRDEEAAYVQAFNEASLMEERFLRQKAKVDWLRDGDANFAYFHKSVKSRVTRSRIDIVTDLEGTVTPLNVSNMFQKRLNEMDALEMIRAVSDKEIKDAVFSMGNDISSGPDSFTAAFFKEAWDIVATDVISAIREFFVNGKLLKEINHTIIALIPKVASPACVNDFRPISCCNVLFKCITKILSNRIKESLKSLISPNQSTFVPGRSISDNILLTQELIHIYHLDRGSPRCAFKIDIQKAYDMVNWSFLKEVLIGDPLSPYLFTPVMEILTLMIRRRVRDADLFTYHQYCSKLELVNLCFVDDLFLFAHGDANSASVIMSALDEFKQVSGLTPSLSKSTAYFCNVLNHVNLSILQILPFKEGRLPVKYLGVPLVSYQLIYRDCKELIEKVQKRVNDWKNKSLSTAGRLQLIQSVIGSLHVFWASVFILPSRILLEIEQIMRGFLWCHGSLSRDKLKVAWEVVCLPNVEGGLGIRRLDTFNKALMVSHIWKILSLKELMWVKWIHAYKLRGRNFWDIPCRGNMTWVGVNFSSDNLCFGNLICITWGWFYDIGLVTKVRDLMINGHLSWPHSWLGKYLMLSSIPDPVTVPSTPDVLEWRDSYGTAKKFSVKTVWYEMKGFAGLPNSSSSIDAILNDIYPFAMKKTSRSVIAKLVLAAGLLLSFSTVPCGMSYGFDSSSLLLEVNAMDMDSVDKNYPKDVQLQDEDIMYDIASSVEIQKVYEFKRFLDRLNDDDAIAVPHEDAQATLGDTNDPFTLYHV